jgi:hypothetical protein
MRSSRFTAFETLTLGRLMMVLSAIAMIAATLVAYPFAERFGLAIQIAGHLVLPVAAALFKLGYVVRLASHHALGNMNAG